ncbi:MULTISPECIES: hypothetical protein [Pseudomonas chlororaphis group]|uniref:hypothetical protein n=1 Tax=Pseudomonas chlororaphis group TaxID=136842 RepID=UPI0020968ACC|nr:MULTISPECIES: hypothetical protein [Pseudomonas chlororaphis group]MCO7578383.1 hypothetical protein [Pseudomonas protegens]MCO7584480.1 hypothetical protein [Pseudomonas chlororaphis]MCO7601469.1 hypothetical protein [Pseudomonas chlororaphis]
MRKFALSAWMLAGLCLHLPLVHAAELIGFREVTLADANQQRPLHVALWYPTTTTAPLLPSAENPIFQGVATIKKEEAPGDEIICRDGDAGDRQDIHRQVAKLIGDFLDQKLAGQPPAG